MRASSQPAPPGTPPARPATAAAAARRRARTPAPTTAGRGAGRAICSLLAGSTRQLDLGLAEDLAWRSRSRRRGPRRPGARDRCTPRSSSPSSAGARCPVHVGQPTWSVTDLHRRQRSPARRSIVAAKLRPSSAEQPGRAHDRVRAATPPAPRARPRASSRRTPSGARSGRTRRYGRAAAGCVARRDPVEHVVGRDVQHRRCRPPRPRARGCRRPSALTA